MQRFTEKLHISLNTVNDNERLGVSIDGVKATNEHSTTTIKNTRTCHEAKMPREI